MHALQANGSTGAYMCPRKQRVPGLPTCHSRCTIQEAPASHDVEAATDISRVKTGMAVIAVALSRAEVA